MQIITKTGEFLLPYPADGEYVSAAVVIHPRGSLNRHARKAIDRHKFAYFIIEADSFDEEDAGARPPDFNPVLLKWAMRSASLIVLWGGQIPFTPDRLTETLKSHVRPGGRIVIALIRDEHHDEWVRFSYEHSRDGVELFGIKGIPGVHALVKQQNCKASGAVH